MASQVTPGQAGAGRGSGTREIKVVLWGLRPSVGADFVLKAGRRETSGVLLKRNLSGSWLEMGLRAGQEGK